VEVGFVTVQAFVVVVVVGGGGGRGNRTFICPELESFNTAWPVESVRVMAEEEEIPGAFR
jgi:hypothetical protein